MPHTFRNFWFPGMLGVILVGIVLRFRLAAGVPFIDELLAKPGPPGFIAASILFVTWWVLLVLLIRYGAGRGELKLTRALLRLVERSPEAELKRFLEDLPRPRLSGGSAVQRVRLVRDRLGECSVQALGSLVSGQSGIDAAHADNAYGPLRALVWALPALGFMGTALEMAKAVGGLGSALGRTQGYNDLRNLLVGQVVPPLAGAFDITLFGLASSVVCFVALSLVYASEERTLLEVDVLSIALLARAGEGSRLASDECVHLLSRDVQGLAEQVGKVCALLAEWQRGEGCGRAIHLIETMSSSLLRVQTTLEGIQEDLDREIVISRRPRRPGVERKP